MRSYKHTFGSTAYVRPAVNCGECVGVSFAADNDSEAAMILLAVSQQEPRQESYFLDWRRIVATVAQ